MKTQIEHMINWIRKINPTILFILLCVVIFGALIFSYSSKINQVINVQPSEINDVAQSGIWDTIRNFIFFTVFGQAIATVLGTALFEYVKGNKDSNKNLDSQNQENPTSNNINLPNQRARGFIYFLITNIGSSSINLSISIILIILPFLYVWIFGWLLFDAKLPSLIENQNLMPFVSEWLSSKGVSDLLALTSNLFFILLLVLLGLPTLIFVTVVEFIEGFLQDWKNLDDLYDTIKSFANQVIAFIQKHTPKMKELADSINSYKQIKEVPTKIIVKPLPKKSKWYTRFFRSTGNLFAFVLNPILIFIQNINWSKVFYDLVHYIIADFIPFAAQLFVHYLVVIFKFFFDILRLFISFLRHWLEAALIIFSQRIVVLFAIIMSGFLLTEVTVVTGSFSAISSFVNTIDDFIESIDYVTQAGTILQQEVENLPQDLQYIKANPVASYCVVKYLSLYADLPSTKLSPKTQEFLSKGNTVEWDFIDPLLVLPCNAMMNPTLASDMQKLYVPILQKSPETPKDVMYLWLDGIASIPRLFYQKLETAYFSVANWFLSIWIPFSLIAIGIIFLCDSLALRYIFLVRPLDPFPPNADKKSWIVLIGIIIYVWLQT